MESFFRTLLRLLGVLAVPAGLGCLTWWGWTHFGPCLGLAIGILSFIVSFALLYYGFGFLALLSLLRNY